MILALPYALHVVMALAGDPSFEDGLRLYNEFEYEQAIPKFNEVAGRAGLVPADKAQALVWLGLSHAGAGDVETARGKLREALVADVNVALPAKVSPRIVTMFWELRAEVTAAAVPVAAPVRPPPPPPPREPFDPMITGGGAAVGVGTLAIVGGVVLAVLAAGSLETANDPTQFQLDAKAALDTANAETMAAAVLLPAGAAIAAAGGVLIGMSLTD